MSKHVRVRTRESKNFTKICIKVEDMEFALTKFPIGSKPVLVDTLNAIRPAIDQINHEYEEAERIIALLTESIEEQQELMDAVKDAAASEAEAMKESFTREAVALKTETVDLAKKLHIAKEDLELEKALYQEAIKAAIDYKLRYEALKAGKTPGQVANDHFVKQCDEARKAAMTEDFDAIKKQAAAARAGLTAKAEARERSSSVFTEAMLLEALKKAERVLYNSKGMMNKTSVCCPNFQSKTTNQAAASDHLTSEMVDEIIYGVKSVVKENPCKDIPYERLSPDKFLKEAKENGWVVEDYLGSVMFTGRSGNDIYTVKKSFVDDYYRVAKNGKVGLKLPVKNEYQLFLPTVTSLIAKGVDLEDISFTAV